MAWGDCNNKRKTQREENKKLNFSTSHFFRLFRFVHLLAVNRHSNNANRQRQAEAQETQQKGMTWKRIFTDGRRLIVSRWLSESTSISNVDRWKSCSWVNNRASVESSSAAAVAREPCAKWMENMYWETIAKSSSERVVLQPEKLIFIAREHANQSIFARESQLITVHMAALSERDYEQQSNVMWEL